MFEVKNTQSKKFGKDQKICTSTALVSKTNIETVNDKFLEAKTSTTICDL